MRIQDFDIDLVATLRNLLEEDRVMCLRSVIECMRDFYMPAYPPDVWDSDAAQARRPMNDYFMEEWFDEFYLPTEFIQKGPLNALPFIKLSHREQERVIKKAIAYHPEFYGVPMEGVVWFKKETKIRELV